MGRPQAEAVAAEAALSGEPEAAEAETVALRGASWAARELFDHAAALRLIDRAVSIAEQHGLTHRQSECLLTRSTIHLEHGRQAAARGDLQDAAALASPETGAEIRASLGVIEQKAGAYAAALSAYQEALDSAPGDLVDVRFKALSNGAVCAARLGRHRDARTMIEQAVEVAKTSSAVYHAHATHNRALLSAERGDLTAALSQFDEAVELWDRANLRRAEHYLEKAETFLALRLLGEADAAVSAALQELEGQPGAALLFSEGLMLAAEIASNRGEMDRAVELNERAASTFAEQERSGWWALAEHAAIAARLVTGAIAAQDRGAIERVEEELSRSGHTSGRVAAALTAARLASASGDVATAVDAYGRCADISRGGSALQRIQGWVAETERADLERDGRRVSSAARAGLNTLDKYRSTFDSIELRARAADHGAELAIHGLRWAVATGRPERVWSWLERTRAAALVGSSPSEPDEHTQAAVGRMRAAAARVAELGPESSESVEAHRELARAEHALRAASWQRSRERGSRTNGQEPVLGQSPTAATLDRIRHDLGTTGLVQYGIVDGVTIAVVVTSERRVFLPLGEADDIDLASRQLAFALRRLGRSAGGAASHAAHTATTAALGRLDELLASRALLTAVSDCSELVVVPPSKMIGIPWGSLPALADRPVAVAPSATAWWVTTRRRPPTDSRTVALAGPDLQHAAVEAQRIADLYTDGTALTDESATGETLSKHVAETGTVHVAAHGHLRRDSPTFSSFQLADGPFTVHDIGRLPAPVQRWVLSSCDLGASGSTGSDLEGIVAALFSAGAGAVVAAVAEVPDESTTGMMVALHSQLAAGASMARALHDARLSVDASNPGERVAQLAFTCYGSV